LHPPGPRHADRAAQPGAGGHRGLPHAVRDEPDAQGDEDAGLRPAAEAPDHADPGARARPGPAARVHVEADADQGRGAVRQAGAPQERQDPQGRPDAGADPGVHDLRAQDGVPDRLPDLPAVPDHRPRRLLDADVDGHDDAAAVVHLAAVQDPAVRPGRRLEPGHVLPRRLVPHMTQDTVVSLVVSMMSVTVKVAAPMLVAGLVVGLVISIFQAVTQIQEQTLSFIPKIVALIAVVAIAGPWMLDTLVTWTQELWTAI